MQQEVVLAPIPRGRRLRRAGETPVLVRLASLVLEDSPRLDGVNEEHTRILLGRRRPPPILVHRQSMRVLDGMHRMKAAELRGRDSTEAVFFDGNQDAAFVEAVKANIAHGLPPSIEDRRRPPRGVTASYLKLSDRTVAASVGLSAKAVRAVRERMSDIAVQPNVRVGRDGRTRPLSAADGRVRAAALIAERPDSSLRDIAATAGISIGTVRDVRRRVRDGEAPVPDGGHRVTAPDRLDDPRRSNRHRDLKRRPAARPDERYQGG